MAREQLGLGVGGALAHEALGRGEGVGRELMGGFLGAGFYYKTFMWPSWRTYEGLIRRLAGLGPAQRSSIGGSKIAWLRRVRKRRQAQGSGRVSKLMCRAQSKTDTLLNPVTNPPGQPGMAQNVTTKAMNFWKPVDMSRQHISTCRPSQMSSGRRLLPSRTGSSIEIGSTPGGQPDGMSAVMVR